MALAQQRPYEACSSVSVSYDAQLQGGLRCCTALRPGGESSPVPWQYSQRRRPLPSQQSHGAGFGFCAHDQHSWC